MRQFFEQLLINYPFVDYLLRLLLATILGFAIGLERKARSKEAGIRTHTIVAVGSALFMIISKYAFEDTLNWDGSRIASQIVSGVGFLGAGMIMHQKRMIHGLTTAAGVWATAGVGMAVGAGMILVSVGATVIIIAIQCLFHLDIKIFRMKRQTQVVVVFYAENNAKEEIAKLFGTTKFFRLQERREGDRILATGTIRTYIDVSDEFVHQAIVNSPYILSIDKSSEDD